MPAKSNITSFDTADYLKTDADIVAYLNAALEEGDLSALNVALGNIARAKGMGRVAEETGLGRESLYKALSSNGNPAFSTIQKVIESLGLSLCVAAPEKPKHKTM